MASSRSSVSSKSAPRGTARRKRLAHCAPRARSSSACATCRRSTNRANPQAGSGSPEAPEQVVVAAAAADHVAERRVVDLEDRAGVVAEVAHQAEVEDHAVGEPALARRRPRRLAAAASACPHVVAAELDRALDHLGPAAQLRQRRPACAACSRGHAELADALLELDEVVALERAQHGACAVARRRPSPSSSPR